MDNKKSRIKLALWLCAGMQTSHLVLTSAISKISDYFPGAGIAFIQLIPTITSLAVIPCAFLAGPLSRKISKRAIILLSLIFMIAGGLLPLIIHENIAVLMVFSSLVGVGVGLISPTISSLISDQFAGEERSRELGRQTASLSIGGMALTFFGGWLANSIWYNAYWSYLLVIPALVVAFIFLPKQKPITKNEKIQSQPKMKLGRQVAFICMLSASFGLVFNIFATNISLFMNERGFSDTALSGAANVAMLAGGLVSGLVFIKLANILKQYTFATVFFACGSGYLVYYLTGSLVFIYIVCFVIGACLGLFVSEGNRILSGIPDANFRSVGMGLFITFNHIGLFFSPIVFTGISDLSNLTTASFRFGLGAIVSLLLASVLLIYNQLKKHREFTRITLQ